MSALGIAFEFVRLLSGLASLAIMVAWYYLVWRIFRWWAYERPGIVRGGLASPRVLLRRLYCRHNVLARGRDPYGKHTVLCCACGTDVNAGKPREEWR